MPRIRRPSAKQIFFPEVKAGGFTRVDGTIEFYTRVNALISSDMTLLDFGAGRGAFAEDTIAYRRGLRCFKGKVARVVGVDIDDAVRVNPFIDEAVVVKEHDPLPIEDMSIGIVVADSTLEHVSDPNFVSREFFRILKPGGWLCARTTNRWGYVAISARLIPENLHRGILRRAQPDRKEEDIFTTVYKMNSWNDIHNILNHAHWDVTIYAISAEPSYFAESILLWRIILLVHKMLPERVNPILLIFAQKNSENESVDEAK